MALQLGRMVSDGIGRVLTRTGGFLLIAFVLLQLLIQSTINTVVIRFFPEGPAGELEAILGLTLPISGSVAGILFAVALVLTSAYAVVLSRAFTRPVQELTTIPRALYTRRIGQATFSTLVGGVIIGVSVTVGLAFLILPGIFLSVCFLFFIFAVGVEDRGVLSALKRSWALSRGNRVRLALLVILAGVIGSIVGAVGSLLDLVGTPIVAELISNTLNSILFVLLYGMMAAAYLQIENDQSRNQGGAETANTVGNPHSIDS